MPFALRRFAPALPLLAFLFLALAPSAGAVTFTVNSTAAGDDAGINGDCDTDPTSDDDCTLRAAIQEANATAAADVIGFSKTNSGSDPDDTAFTTGQAAPVVTVGGAIPTITHALTIGSGNCSPDQALVSPCVVVGTGWVVDSDGEVSINGLVFSGAGVGIDVQHAEGNDPSLPDFEMSNNWFGSDMNGNQITPPSTAVLLQDVDGAQIGDEVFAENLFARHGQGVRVLGADNTEILNNRFGVMQDGSFARAGGNASANGDNIEVVGDSTPEPDDEATGTVIRENSINYAGISQSNIPQSNDGIDLGGDGGNEIPADGAIIRRNEIGVDGLNSNAIEVGAADDVVIGGSGNLGNALGANGLTTAAGAENLLIQGNVMGADSSAPTLALQGSGQVVGNNLVSGGPHAAIQLANTSGSDYVVQGNVIGETAAGLPAATGNIGVSVLASSSGNLIGGTAPGEGNLFSDASTLVNPTTINSLGIRLAGDDNEVLGNRIGVGSDGSARPLMAGIDLTDGASGNTIGGASQASENLISNANGGNTILPGNAITIAGTGSDGNEILRNRGSGNEGLFIDLGGDGPGNVADPGGVNAGVQAPAITEAAPTTVSGTTTPNAVIRIFTKADSSAGELGGFIGQLAADNLGDWSATVPEQAPGTLITATATSGSDTSELAAPVAVPDDTDPPPPPPPPPGGDADPPETRIDKAPKNKLKVKRTGKATYEFSADETGSTFLCTIDGKPQAPCSSPLKLKRLKKGRHAFSVVAVDPAGNADASPATDTFKVKKRRKRKR